MCAVSEFGDLVRQTRESRGLSQERLAALAKLTPGYISLIETGKRGSRPGRDTVLGIAQALGVPPKEMLRAAGRLRPGDNVEQPPSRPSFEVFVQSDPELRSDQKEILIRTYRSWVRRTP